MGKDSLLRLEETVLFKLLIKKEKNLKTNESLSSKVYEIVEEVTPLLATIHENMPQFTLHDPNHSAKVIEIMSKIIPPSTLNKLNVIEIALLILSGYLHDIGMVSSKKEKEGIIKTNEEFRILFKSDLEKNNKYEEFKNKKDHRSATFIQDQVYTEYLRRNHIKRTAQYIKKKLTKGKFELNFNSIPLSDYLIAICDSHGEPVNALSNLKKWQRNTLLGEYIVNIQYLSLILRLADILDLDPERTPKVIYEFVDPTDPISIKEWNKHRAIIGSYIDYKQVIFSAKCKSPEVERALKEFMHLIEHERKQSMKLLLSYSDDISKKYKLELHDEIKSDQIESDESYIYNDLKFEINYQRVLDLLMGKRLYKNPILALRELLQNSIDAIKIREKIFKEKKESFKPLIEIEIKKNELIISDNGVGMDENIFKEFFLQVGKSFYSSPIFYSRFSDIDVTSEFGIGILSTFMISTSLIIESRKEPENPLNPSKPIYFEIPTAYSYTIQRESTRTDIGTTIILKLRDKTIFENSTLENVLNEILPIPPYKIKIKEGKSEYFFIKKEVKNNEVFKISRDSDLSEISAHISKFRNSLGYEKIDDYLKLFEINFNSEKSKILKFVEGRLSILNSNTLNWTNKVKGFLSQRCFRIGSPIQSDTDNFKIGITDNIKNLFPFWTSYYSELNLTKSACLTITPDRTDIILDEKYTRLKTAIEKKIISEYKKYLNEIANNNSEEFYFFFIDTIVALGFLGVEINQKMFVFSQDALEFFSDFLSIPVLEFDGNIRRKTIKEIKQSQTIGIIKDNWNDKYINNVLPEIKKHNINLLILDKINFWSQFGSWDRLLAPLLGNQKGRLVPHTLITKFLPEIEIEIIKLNNVFSNNSGYGEYNSIIYSLSNKEEQLLFSIRDVMSIYPDFNQSHKLFSLLLDENGNYKDIKAFNLIRELSDNLSQRINDSIEKLSYSDQEFSKKYISFNSYKNRNRFKLTAGLFIKDKELLDKIKNDIKNYWENAQKLNLISTKENVPEISNKDFLHTFFKT